MGESQIPFLRQLPKEDAEALLARVRRRTLKAGAEILRAGSAGDEAVVVLSGQVRLVAYGADNREVVLALRGPGELIGEIAALGAGRRTATAVALDETEVGYLKAAELVEYLRDHPDASLLVIRMVVRRLAEATRDMVDLATQDSVGRLAKRLVELSAVHGRPSGEGTQIELALTQDELARWTGATRETVSRALRLMRQLGWVSTDRRTITVLDPAALRERSGNSAT
ncbi:MAG TPA: Crp/Fnr family transcriptional regulator [Solirubrobacteraceae bacterium]|nr:Crp/Fnr family transcriptional regulator [Solirubrobacteraceae bacterium]